MRKSALIALAPVTRNRWLTATRTLGALALLVVGGVHFQIYHYEFYSRIPTIGPLFLVNFIAATVLGLLLLAPVRHRHGRLDRAVALAGIAVAAAALVALLISEHTTLFGFMEHGYRFAIVLAITSEAAVTATLTVFLLLARSRASGPGASGAFERSTAAIPSQPVNHRPVGPSAAR